MIFEGNNLFISDKVNFEGSLIASKPTEYCCTATRKYFKKAEEDYLPAIIIYESGKPE